MSLASITSITSIAVAALAVGCGPATKSAAGIVVAVDQASVTEIRNFTLRTETGDMLTFRIGALDVSSGAFPANHLREHMAVVSAVAVAYTDADGALIAVRLVDAPWLER